MPKIDPEKLREWFYKERRDFPWRHDVSPYKVWISEIMLQQTRASVVVGYFEQWMERYPDMESLARASEDELMKIWEGLGYYNRVRNIKKAAIYFLDQYKGQIPDTKDELFKVPGLGSYTVGAILSFAFKQKAPAVDANVMRVMSRYFGIAEDISTSQVQKKIHELTNQFLPDDNPHEVMEGLIELGASVCGRSPCCHRCPLKSNCHGFMQGTAQLLPIKKKKKPSVELFKKVYLVKCSGCFLVQQKPKGKVLGGLYEFPSIDQHADVPCWIGYYDPDAVHIEDLKKEFYTYTNHVVELFPSLWETSKKFHVQDCKWASFHDLMNLPFTSGHKRILKNIFKEEFYESPTY